MGLAGELSQAARVRLTLVAVACAAVVAFAPHRTFLPALLPLDVGTAQVTGAVLRWCGLDVWREGPVLRHASGFSCEIYYRCTGLLQAGFAVAMIAAWPATARLRWKSVVLAVTVLWTVNIVRLAGVIAVGIQRPSAFGLAHDVVGEAATVLAVLAVWVAWMRAAAGEARRSVA